MEYSYYNTVDSSKHKISLFCTIHIQTPVMTGTVIIVHPFFCIKCLTYVNTDHVVFNTWFYILCHFF